MWYPWSYYVSWRHWMCRTSFSVLAAYQNFDTQPWLKFSTYPGCRGEKKSDSGNHPERSGNIMVRPEKSYPVLVGLFGWGVFDLEGCPDDSLWHNPRIRNFSATARKFWILACLTWTSPLYMKSSKLSISSKETSHNTRTGFGAGFVRKSFRKNAEQADKINLWAFNWRPSMARVTSKKSSCCRMSDMVAMTLSCNGSNKFLIWYSWLM